MRCKMFWIIYIVGKHGIHFLRTTLKGSAPSTLVIMLTALARTSGAFPSEQENQREIRHPFRHFSSAIPQLALKCLAAKNNEDARSFGMAWVEANTHARGEKHWKTHGNEEVKGNSEMRRGGTVLGGRDMHMQQQIKVRFLRLKRADS